MSDREQADILLNIDNKVWRMYGFKSGMDTERNWDKYRMAIADRTPYFVTKGVMNIIDGENHHSLSQALRQLGRTDR